jgi:hypothetical protein
VSNKFVPTERNLQNLLMNLGADQKPYPKNLMDNRRTAYLSQVTAVISSGPHPKQGNGQGHGGAPHGAAPMTPVMKVVLTTLVAANVVLATYLSMVAYENWDKVQEFLFGIPATSETSSAPEILTQSPELEMTPEITVPPEITVSPIATPEPTDLSDNSQTSGEDSVDNNNPSGLEVGTPEPTGDDSPGLHLGQTPHSPDTPPGQSNQNSSQDNTKDNNQDNQDKNKDKNNKNK